MNTIDAFAHDVLLQLEYLKKFVPQKAKLGKNAIFCGSGDSLCAGMLAAAFSDYSVMVCDPLELAKNKTLARTSHAYFVSISGNTISNIRAARLAKRSVAITRNPASKLGKTCDGVLPLVYTDSGVLTAGSIGFLASALSCVSMVYDFKIKNAKKIFALAKNTAKKISLKNQTYILGNQHTYPIAMYASAKLGEILGMDSHYEKIEQFSHMGLFTAKPGDTIIILEPKNNHNSQLSSNLKNLGLKVYNPSIMSKNKIDQVLFYIFVSQFVALNMAHKKRIKECYFISHQNVRAASSDMIY
jgi:glucosamine 6-phosphate synthetase-like amidotransferase/phosphosugar isomerase protein